MPMERSRIIRSSSQGEIGLLNQIRSIESPAAFLDKKPPAAPTKASKPEPKPVKYPKTEPKPVRDEKPPVVAEKKKQPGRSIFTLGSPEREKKIDDNAWSKKKKRNEGFGEFLRACYLCKKKFVKNQDMYMYGYLGAFCSPECQDDQMSLDGFEEEFYEDYAERMKAAGKLTIKGVPRLGHLR